jgi:hypothetical protein
MGVPTEAIPDAEAAARWLLVEWRKDGTIKYALSNLPPLTTLEQVVGFWKERWQVERGYEQLKGELGLDHFEGRSWPGFHHHAAMTFLAYGFLALERQWAQDARAADDPTLSGEHRRGKPGTAPDPHRRAPCPPAAPVATLPVHLLRLRLLRSQRSY